VFRVLDPHLIIENGKKLNKISRKSETNVQKTGMVLTSAMMFGDLCLHFSIYI
jgi:hypothetical protein